MLSVNILPVLRSQEVMKSSRSDCLNACVFVSSDCTLVPIFSHFIVLILSESQAWNLEGWDLLQSVDTAEKVACLACCPDGSVVAVGTNKGVLVLDADTLLLKHKVHYKPERCLHMSQDSSSGGCALRQPEMDLPLFRPQEQLC